MGIISAFSDHWLVEAGPIDDAPSRDAVTWGTFGEIRTKAELPHSVYAYVYCIALCFQSDYLAYYKQDNLFKNG